MAVRASNLQREQVVKRLDAALVEGRLSVPEFEERSVAASQTLWVDELPAFTADLPRRATFEQRAHVVERLGEAAAQGYLRFPEFEERAAAVNETVWMADLARFTADLPPAFRSGLKPAGGSLPGLAAVRRHPVRAALVAGVVALAGIGIPLMAGGEERAPVAAPATSPVAAPPSVESSPSPSPSASPTPSASATSTPSTSPTSTPSASATPTPFTPAVAIACYVGSTGDKETFRSLAAAWAADGGTYFCEAEVASSYRPTKREKSAVDIDQRIGNGDSRTDSLEVLLGFCADTVEYELDGEGVRPTNVGDFERVEENRLAAMYQLCPTAPTARLMRDVIRSR